MIDGSRTGRDSPSETLDWGGGGRGRGREERERGKKIALKFRNSSSLSLAPIIQKVDSAIYWINHRLSSE